MKKKEIAFMGFSTGSDATAETTVFSKYYGVAPVSVLAINPTKEELQKILNLEEVKEQNYISKLNINNKEIDTIRITFWVKVDKDKTPSGYPLISNVSFRLQNTPRMNKDGSKVQMIDKYGDTSWMLVEEVKNKTFVLNEKMLFSGEDMRPAYVGEEDLTNFIKAYLGIPLRATLSQDNVWMPIKDPSKAYARFTNIQSFFGGNVKEIKDAISQQPNNLVYACFGVKTTEENKMYQVILPSLFFFVKKFSDKSRKFLQKRIDDLHAVGMFADTVFSSEDLSIYEIKPTVFSAVETKPEIPMVNTSKNPFENDLPF